MRRTHVLLASLLVGSLVLTGWSSSTARRLGPSLGLLQTYYSTPEFDDAQVSRRVPQIDLEILEENPELPREWFSIRWEGFWDVKGGGPVDVYAGADDAVTVWIDERPVVERSPDVGMHTDWTRLELSPGLHPIRIDYIQHGGGTHLNVEWAPAGQPARPLNLLSLFPANPRGETLRAARLGAALDGLARLGWLSVLAIALVFVVLPLLLNAVDRVEQSDRLRRMAARASAWWIAWRERVTMGAFAVALGGATSWTAYVRWGVLDPPSLWADDVWVASLTKLDRLWTAVGVATPVPPAFVALLWGSRRLFADPELSLQLLPFICGLIGPPLLGVVVWWVSSSHALGVVAAGLALLNPYVAYYSIFVKQYTVDYVVTTVFLALAMASPPSDPRRLRLVAAFGIAAALISIPSVFSGGVLIHLALLATLYEGYAQRTPIWSRVKLIVAFDGLLALIVLFVLRPRSNPALGAFWRNDFLPLGDWAAAAAFLGSNGRAAVEQAFPFLASYGALLAAVGIVWLLAHPRWRNLGFFALLFYATLLLASGLGLYPIGQEFRGRTIIYTYPVTMLLSVMGFHALTGWLPMRSIFHVAAATLVMTRVFLAPASVAYMQLDHADLVNRLHTRADAADGIVLNSSGAYLAGYYAPWSVRAVPDDSQPGFQIQIDRPRALTLPRGAEEGQPALGVLAVFLASERPARVFFFSTRRGIQPALDEFERQRYAEVRRWSSTVSTHLIEFQRAER